MAALRPLFAVHDLLFFSNELLALLARHVGDAHLKHAESLPGAVDHLVVLRLGVVGRVFEGEFAYRCALFCVILDDADAAEDNDAAKCGRIFFRDDLVLIDYGEGRMRILTDGVDLVPLKCAVKVDVRTVIDVADRHSIGKGLVPRERKHTGRSAQEHGLGFLRRKLLYLAAHRVEHHVPPYQKRRISAWIPPYMVKDGGDEED